MDELETAFHRKDEFHFQRVKKSAAGGGGDGGGVTIS